MTVLKMTTSTSRVKRVLIREDLNVPVKDGQVQSDARIKAALPTLKLALEKGAAVMVCSHLGRPTGEFSAENNSAEWPSTCQGPGPRSAAAGRLPRRRRGQGRRPGAVQGTCASTRARRTLTSWRRSTPRSPACS